MLDESNHEHDVPRLSADKKFEDDHHEEENDTQKKIEEPNQIILSFKNPDVKTDDHEDKDKYPFDQE